MTEGALPADDPYWKDYDCSPFPGKFEGWKKARCPSCGSRAVSWQQRGDVYRMVCLLTCGGAWRIDFTPWQHEMEDDR